MKFKRKKNITFGCSTGMFFESPEKKARYLRFVFQSFAKGFAVSLFTPKTIYSGILSRINYFCNVYNVF